MGIVVSLAAARVRRALENVGNIMDVEEAVGLHRGCGGNIVYSAKIVPDRSRPGMLVRGSLPMKTEVKCFCERCKRDDFDPNHPAIQRKLSEIFGE